MFARAACADVAVLVDSSAVGGDGGAAWKNDGGKTFETMRTLLPSQCSWCCYPTGRLTSCYYERCVLLSSEPPRRKGEKEREREREGKY